MLLTSSRPAVGNEFTNFSPHSSYMRPISPCVLDFKSPLRVDDFNKRVWSMGNTCFFIVCGFSSFTISITSPITSRRIGCPQLLPFKTWLHNGGMNLLHSSASLSTSFLISLALDCLINWLVDTVPEESASINWHAFVSNKILSDVIFWERMSWPATATLVLLSVIQSQMMSTIFENFFVF